MFALAALMASTAPVVATDVVAGIDLFQSPPGSSFTDDFNSGAGGSPLPPGFFDPGSDPFDGRITLDGDPFPYSGNGPCLAPADTIVERLADAPLPVCPSSAIVPIQIVALSLVSTQPIVVTYNGGLNPEQWDVRACLSDLPQQQGTMQINHDCPDGGSFSSTLPVLPKFIFTRQSDNTVRIFDAGLQAVPPTVFSTLAGWVHQSTISQVTQVGPGSEVDGNCDGVLEVLPVGTSNFVPGIFPAPCDCSIPPGGSQQFKKLTGEQAALAAHGILPAQDPPDTNGNGIPDACEGTEPPKPVEPKWTQLPHGFLAGDMLLGSQPVAAGTSRVWEIAAPGGPDNPQPAIPAGALSGLANIGHGIIGTSGHGGGGAIHELTCDGQLVSSRAPTDPNIFAMPGASTAPPAAVAFGFTPGHVYATADTGSGLADSLYDIGLDGAGPDINRGPLTDVLGNAILGIDGLAFDKSTGQLYGSTGFSAFPSPHLVQISAFATVTDLGAILVGGSIPAGAVAGLAFEGGTLYGSIGGGVGDLIVIPPAAPGTATLDHNVTAAAGGGSLSGLAPGCGEGFNVPSDLDWIDMDPDWVIADDFQSDGRPITCVRWWGSYVDHRYQPIGPGDPTLPGACCFDDGSCIDVPTESECIALGGKVFLPGELCIDEPCGREIDGWLVSFHTDLPADQSPDKFSQPLDLLGLYFCPEASVQVLETNIVGWDGHCVYEYVVELEHCHLLHSLIDPRPGAMPPDPAREVAFCETEDFIYWLDIQAVVGHTYLHGVPCDCNCDFNGDLVCDTLDLAAFQACFGTPTPPGCDQADFNCDGAVDALDEAIMMCLLGGGSPDQCCPQGNPKSYFSQVGLPIPDGGAVSDTITVADSGPIVDVNVDLLILHPHVGDLVVQLTHGGVTVTLIDRPGDPVPFPGLGCPTANYNIILDDEGAGGAIETLCVPNLSSPPNYTPNNPLSAFDGLDKAGDWTLTVIDTATGNVGLLDAWSLHLVNEGADQWIEVTTQNHAEDHYWGWHTSPDHWNDESVQGTVVMDPNGEWLYPDWKRVDGTEHFPGCYCQGDVNSDGVANGSDIQGFIRCLLNVPLAVDNCACVDMNRDGAVNLGDIGAFVLALLNGCHANVPVDQAFELLTPSQTGACCLSPTNCVTDVSQVECEECLGGIYIGDKEECPTTTVFVVTHTATQWSHSIQTVVDCPNPAGGLAGCTDEPFEIDPWTTEPGGTSCEDFSHPDACPIPADFFGPGSDPFTGSVCFEGVPLGVTPYGEFGDADTLVLRTQSPFDRCDVSVPFPTPSVDVSIEVVEMHLTSASPITVTYNGGQNPEAWDVEVTLSDTPAPSFGTLTAVKTHCNGGTYDSNLSVFPKFTFTRVSDMLQMTLDTGLSGCNPVEMNTSGDSWVHDPHPNLGLQNPVCTDFFPGVEDQNPVDQSICDCDSNGIRDICETDSDGDGTIDACDNCPNEPALVDPDEPGMELTCDDGIDNDCDGDTDGADPDCP